MIKALFYQKIQLAAMMCSQSPLAPLRTPNKLSAINGLDGQAGMLKQGNYGQGAAVPVSYQI